jgi:hypothetical protein
VDKPQVFALKLNRRNFSENPRDWIRRKFSIDDGPERIQGPHRRIHDFETIAGRPETRRSPSASNERRRRRPNPVKMRSGSAGAPALAFA